MPYIGNTIRAADDYRLIDDISSGFDGSETSFALQVAGSAPVPFPKSPQQVLISVNGVIQEPDPTGNSGFNLVGTNIVFSSAPTNGHAFFGIIYATADYLNAGGNFPAGSLGAPSITFIGDENTGLFRKGSGSVGFVSDATEIANFDSNGITISSGNIIIPDSIIHNGDANTKIRFPATDTISLETAGSERLRITSAGLVCVGHDADKSGGDTNALLQLFTPTAAKILLGRSDTSISSGNFLGIIDFHGTDGTSSQRGARIGAVASGDHGTDDKPTDLVFQTTADGAGSSTERMRIDSDGKVGIGTTSPTSTLHLDASGGAVVQLQRTSSNASNRLVISHDGTDGTLDSSNALLFRNNGAERARITSTGRLGIGTTAPQMTLDVLGDFAISNSSSSYWNFDRNNSSGDLIISDTGTERMRIAVAGTKPVLIGCSTVTSDKFAVLDEGNAFMSIRSDAASDDVIQSLDFVVGEAERTSANMTGAITAIVHSQSGGTLKSDLQFRTNSGNSVTQKMVIKDTGKVGIGTTTPEETLDLGNATQMNLKIGGRGYIGQAFSTAATILGHSVKAKTTGSTSGGMIVTETNSGGGAPSAVRMQSGNIEFHTAASGTQDADFNSNERMRIDASGRVIVGATSHIGGAQFVLMGGNINTYGAMAIGNKATNPTASTSIAQFRFNSGATGTRRGAEIIAQTDGNWTDGSSHPTRLLFSTTDTNATGATERMRIHSNGSISVGVNQNNGIFCVSEPTATHAQAVRFKASTSSALSNTTAVIIDIHGFYSNNYNAFGLTFKNSDDGAGTARTAKAIQFVSNAGSEVGSIQQNQNSTSFNTSSDYRLKENATAISDGITRLKTLKPYRFNFKGQTQVVDGFFAHEVTAVPEAITGVKDEMQPETRYEEGDTIPSGKVVGDAKTYSSTEMKLQSIDQSKLVPLLTAALQEEISKREALETRIAALEAA